MKTFNRKPINGQYYDYYWWWCRSKLTKPNRKDFAMGFVNVNNFMNIKQPCIRGSNISYTAVANNMMAICPICIV